MLNFKLILAILGLLLSFVTMGSDKSIINNSDTNTALDTSYMATVTSPKAIVYADENMLSPLGYIANGKVIKVGNPRRMNRDLVPLVIYGRIAFIEIKDIRYNNQSDDDYSVKRGAPREHNFDVTIESPTEKLTENNSAYFTLHRYGVGDETKRTFLAIHENATVSNFTGFQLQLIHRKPVSRIFWGAHLDYSSTSAQQIKFNYLLLGGTVGYTLMRNQMFLLEIYGSLDLSINSKFDIIDNFENEPNGWVWGFQGNSRIVLFPESRYHPTAGMGIRRYNVVKLAPVNDYNGRQVDGIEHIFGISIFVGLGMEFN